MTRIAIALIPSLLVGLPLLGVALAGKPLARYLEFPPVTRYVEHAPFSWWFFLATVVFIVGAVAPLLMRVVTSRRGPIGNPLLRECNGYPAGATGAPDSSRLTPHAFPWWGWLGLGITSLDWVLAWNRFPWLGDLQSHTFTPLWIGYILVINALTFKRTGSCMMLDRPRYFLLLFLLSATFWWFFEYLNRFVQNWYYGGAREFTATEYFWYATLPFSTVLPAVLSTRDWLATYPRLSAGLDKYWPMQVRQPTVVGWMVLVLAGGGLMGIGIWPDYLFPLLWISPLLIITSLQAVLGEETVFSCIARGDWRPIWLPAVAALVCGFFWEMWNFNSLAHWEYAVPFVHRFQLFEMPLLGYAGYLPFGLECVVVAQLFIPERGVSSRSQTKERCV